MNENQKKYIQLTKKADGIIDELTLNTDRLQIIELGEELHELYSQIDNLILILNNKEIREAMGITDF
ncbi:MULTISPECIES: hypothetical protein [unclassified Listeria]|uniref:hypothetical protein n=1 Tax=unclassified Listeria TaxID=2642072 RepID=UPI000B597F6D|nr:MULTISPECIES: hypothetical protein [unclassified Listeria]